MKTYHLRLSAWAVLVAATLAIGAAPASAAEKSRKKIDRAVQNAIARGERTQRVIVTVQPGYRETLRQALKKHGDVVKSEQTLVEGVAADLHSEDVNELAKLPWVKDIAADAIVHATAGKKAFTPAAAKKAARSTKSTSTTAAESFTSTLRQTLGLTRTATRTTDGAGVTVAIIDSGIAPNADFAGRIKGFWDFTNGGVKTAPFDDYGHGTHVAGLVGSSGVQSNFQFQGVAPDVKFVGLKVLDSTGAGYTSDVISALEFVIANKARLNIQIVNLSLGHPIYAPAGDDPLVQTVEKATKAGLIVIVSAGNFGRKENGGDSGYLGITSPGNAPSALTVGAADHKNTITRDDDVVATYSSRGPTWFDAFAKPDMVAPGSHLVSDTTLNSYLYNLVVKGQKKAKSGQNLLELSGASMATAVASGVAALAIQAHNQNGLSTTPVSANLMKAILEFTAIPIAGFDHLSQGAGEINAAGAMVLAKAIDTDVPVGQFWLTMGVTPSTTIGRQSYSWSQHVIWNDVVLGGDFVYVNSEVFAAADDGDNIVWGTADDGDNIVWGTADDADNIVWGTADEGDNIVWGTGMVAVEASNIVWGTTNVWAANDVWRDRNVGAMSDDGDNIVWGTADDGDNIIWGTSDDGDNIVWGTADDGDNIIWGTAAGAF